MPLLLTSFNIPLGMSLVKSSFYDAILLVVAFTSTWQKTAAQAVLCGQFENWNSTSGQYMSMSRLGASTSMRHNLTRIHSSKQRLGCRRFRITVHNCMIFPVNTLAVEISKSLTGGRIARWNDILDDVDLEGKSDLCFTDQSALVRQYQINNGHPPGDAFEHRST